MRVEVTRSGRVESVHEVDVAVADGAGRLLAASGAVDRPVFLRSAVKPFQALPLVEDGGLERFGLDDEALALCCASHSGQPEHVAVAARILASLGLGEADLACGPHAPFHGAAARSLREAGIEPGRLHNNCSGKHAGMLALALTNGWPTAGYQEPDHPVQRRMQDELARWSGAPAGSMGVGVDGCGVATFALPLASAAAAFGRLAGASRAGGGGGPARVLEAMARHPFLVGGTNRLDTALAEATGGRVLAKVGAEGVYGAVSRGEAVGVVLKVRDGARRAAEPALVAVLGAMGLLTAEEAGALERWARPAVMNTRAAVVGAVNVVANLERRDG